MIRLRPIAVRGTHAHTEEGLAPQPHQRRAALELRLLIALIARQVRNDLDRQMRAAGLGGWLQHAVLTLLGERSLTISEISRRLGVEPATLVPVVDALEREGLARRGQDPHDRRRSPLTLTERGQEKLARTSPMDQQDVLLSALHRLGDPEASRLLDMLRRLARLLSVEDEALQNVAVYADMHAAANGSVSSVDVPG